MNNGFDEFLALKSPLYPILSMPTRYPTIFVNRAYSRITHVAFYSKGSIQSSRMRNNPISICQLG